MLRSFRPLQQRSASSFQCQITQRKFSLNFSRPIRSAAAVSPAQTETETAMEANSFDLLCQVKALIPPLAEDKYKGQAGKVGVIGGCREYTGAPYFAAYSALKVGADLSHVFCTAGAAAVIKTYSPELIVHPYIPEIDIDAPEGQVSAAQRDVLCDRAVTAIATWLPRFDVLVVVPGLGCDPCILEIVAKLLLEARRLEIPLVIDADGLWLVNQKPDLIVGYEKAVVTPNAAEFRRLTAQFGIEEGAEDALQQVAQRLDGPVVVRKGKNDVVSDGISVLVCSEQGSLRRAGGQGDVLSGTIAAFIAWSEPRNSSVNPEKDEEKVKKKLLLSPLMIAAYGGCLTTRRACV